MLADIRKGADGRMKKSLESLQHELAKIRTGRAHPSLLEHIHVDFYGANVPLNQAASITAEDSRTLAVTPFDKTMVAAIEKAIMTSDLGLNPNSAGQVIRVPLPSLTEDRRKELGKVVAHEGEQAKIAIRNIRRDANNQLKDLLKSRDITEDDERRGESQIQELTDRYVAMVDERVEAKEKELLEI